MKENSLVHIAKTCYLLLSVIYLILGLTCMIRPDLSYLVLSRALAVVWIISGGIRILSYFSKDLYDLAFQYDFGLGIFMIIIGFILFFKAPQLVPIFSIVAGLAILADGLFKIQMSMEGRTFGIEKWWVLFLLAVATCLFGALLIFEPDTYAHLIMELLGIGLIFEGVLNIAMTILAVKICKKHTPVVYEADYMEREE